MNGWIGVDLDGTLAFYDYWRGGTHIGSPIPKMLERVKRWLAEGRRVKIFTARAVYPEQIVPITAWLVEVCKLPPLEITNVKDLEMDELWDDRAVQVEKNMGDPVGKSTRGLD